MSDFCKRIPALLTVCLVTAVSFLRFHFTFQALLAAIWMSILVQAAVKDQRTGTIPDYYTICLFLIALASLLLMPGRALGDRLAGMVIVSLPMVFIDIIVPGGFGGGDIKLLAATGLFLGWKRNLLAALLALLAAGVYGFWLMITGKAGRKDSFPLGPFLCAGLLLILLYFKEV